MIRCRVRFALLRSVFLCVKGTRSKLHCPLKLDMMDIMQSEACLELTHQVFFLLFFLLDIVSFNHNCCSSVLPVLLQLKLLISILRK